MAERFKLWLEFELWAPQPDDDPETDFFNMRITLTDGRKYALNVWTYKYLIAARREDRQTGENLGGKYLLPPDLFVERCDRQELEAIVSELISTDSLGDEWLVSNLDDNTIVEICDRIHVVNPTMFDAELLMRYLSEFSQKHQIFWPEDYLCFARKFGTGEFDDGGLCFFPPRMGTNATECSIVNRELKLHPDRREGRDRWIWQLINNAIFFAIDGASNYYLWDTTTYQNIDDSYDIYSVCFDEFEDVIKVGRNFSSFLEDFCVDRTKSVGDLAIVSSLLDPERTPCYYRTSFNESLDWA